MNRQTRARRNPLLFLALLAIPAAGGAQTSEQARWRAQAARVTITRDDWGIAHVHGRSDADAVFGAIYAQAEDDFPRIEANYLTALGRTAEAKGEDAIWADLRQRLYADPVRLQAQYRASPAWLRALMDAWADGLNDFLATHPSVKPQVLTRFEPWMALSFTEGSIGGDIERISLSDLASFYGGKPIAVAGRAADLEPRGSNGIAIAPKNTANGHALLLINPHTSFYFRSELQMTSDAGLDAYGASTWGQFFIYQGFNPRAGWMHTSSGVDSVDEFAETVTGSGANRTYRYGKTARPVTARKVTIAFRRADGSLGRRTFTTYATHHGPIVAARAGKWIAQALMWRPIPALEQSWLRTKATDLAGYLQVASRQANSSNDTIFADAKGEIAYLHPQFVPVRSDRFDYTHAVDGSDPATDWHGLTPLAKLPQAIDPASGYVFNTNNWPWTAAGSSSPKAADFPRYMDSNSENARGLHAAMLLEDKHDWTAARLMAAAYDSYLPAFAALLPPLVSAYDALPKTDPRKVRLAAPVALLRRWDYRWGGEIDGNVARGGLGRHATTRGRIVPGQRILQRAAGDRHQRAGRSAAFRARRRGRPDDARFRRLAGRMGQDQSLPAARRPHRPAFRRRVTEHPGAVYIGAMGQPRIVRRAALSEYHALLRNEREQLRRGRRVRAEGEGLGRDCGRRKRRCSVAPFPRPDRSICDRHASPRLFLS